MKIGIISDTHGNRKAIDKALKQFPEAELWLHAGDYTRDGEYLVERSPVPVKLIAGNNDIFFGNDYPQEELFVVHGQTIWLTHGHKQHVKWDLSGIAERAQEIGADIAVFGHTHEAVVEYARGVLLVNPGGATAWEKGGYALLDIDENGRMTADLKQLD